MRKVRSKLELVKELLELVKERPYQLTYTRINQYMGMHPRDSRKYVDALTQYGLLVRSSERSYGAIYAITPYGEQWLNKWGDLLKMFDPETHL